jgi:hypothetical protein
MGQLETRWLIWDGFYSLFGECNQPLAPIDSIRGVRQRLRRLGFYRGDRLKNDEQLDSDLARAIVEFKAFPDSPTKQHTTELNSATRSGIDSVFTGPLGGKELDSKARTKPIPVSHEQLTTKVVSVPSAIDPFNEFAGIEIQIGRLVRVESMLLRIYRNYDPATDNGREIPKERLVYQEVLDKKAVQALLQSPPGPSASQKNIGGYSPEATTLLREKRLFNNGYVCRAHAPYKVRVWVSSSLDTFAAYADPTRAAWKDLAPRAEAFEFARDRGPAATDDPHPTLKENQDVHDQANFGGRAAASSWTGVDNAGVNLLQQPCPVHDASFIARNRQLSERFIFERFRDQPVKTYLDLYRRAAASADGNFGYPELDDTFENIRRHINRIRQRICCGRDSAIGAEIKIQINRHLDLLEQDVEKLFNQVYPYHDSLRFVAKFMEMVDWITYHTRTVPELRHYQLMGKGEDEREWTLNIRRLFEELARLRNLRDGLNYSTQLRLFTTESLADIYNAAGGKSLWQKCRLMPALNKRDLVVLPSYNPLDEVFFVKIRQVPMFVVGLIDLEYLIADSHRYSPFEFFSHDAFHIFSNQDEGEKTPQLWRSLFNRASELDPKNGFGDAAQRERLIRQWDAYATHIQSLLAQGTQQGADFQRALEILLFCVFHEPIDTGTSTSKASFSPAIMEPASAQTRLAAPSFVEKIEERARNQWFGPLSQAVIGQFRAARDFVLQNLQPAAPGPQRSSTASTPQPQPAPVVTPQPQPAPDEDLDSDADDDQYQDALESLAQNDVELIAETLRLAAADGVPFCNDLAPILDLLVAPPADGAASALPQARLRQEALQELRVDAIATALREAAASGAPFCIGAEQIAVAPADPAST